VSAEQNTNVSESVRRRNFRTGVLLGLLAVAFFVGFLAKFAILR
jgi:hypothetical protein